MAKTYKIKLAGKEYALRYGLKERIAIERAINADRSGPQRNGLDAATGGIAEENAAVTWAGIKHAEGADFTVDNVIDLMAAHIEDGGDFYRDVYRPLVLRAVFESRIFGPFEPAKIDRWCGPLEVAQAPVVPQ